MQACHITQGRMRLAWRALDASGAHQACSRVEIHRFGAGPAVDGRGVAHSGALVAGLQVPVPAARCSWAGRMPCQVISLPLAWCLAVAVAVALPVVLAGDHPWHSML